MSVPAPRCDPAVRIPEQVDHLLGPAVGPGGLVELADPGQLPDDVLVAQGVRGVGELVVGTVGVMHRDTSEPGQDPELDDRLGGSAVLIDVIRRQPRGGRYVQPVVAAREVQVSTLKPYAIATNLTLILATRHATTESQSRSACHAPRDTTIAAASAHR